MGPIQAPAWRKVPESFDTGEERIPTNGQERGFNVVANLKIEIFAINETFCR